MRPVTTLTRNVLLTEALVFFVLLEQLFAETIPWPVAGIWYTSAHLTIMVTMILGQALPTVRKASWIMTTCLGFVSIAFAPGSGTGPICLVASAFAMIHSGMFPARRSPLFLAFFAVLILLQGFSVTFHLDQWLWVVGSSVLADSILFYLVVRFRDYLLDGLYGEKPELNLSSLTMTERETQTLHLFWGGQNCKEIATTLSVSVGTVRKDLSSLYRKFRVPGGKELFVLSFTHDVRMPG